MQYWCATYSSSSASRAGSCEGSVACSIYVGAGISVTAVDVAAIGIVGAMATGVDVGIGRA